MAGLAKPKKCEECNSVDLHREWQPERWVCHNNHIVLSRNKKPQTGICTKCGQPKSEGVKFKEGKNLCMDCYNSYMREWNDKSLEERKKYKRDYYAKNRVRIRKQMNSYWQGSTEAFMSDVFRKARKCSVARFGKYNRVVEFKLTYEFLMELFNKQDGRCAISGLNMVHKWNSLYSISLDRIDSSKDYTEDNVQFVCQGINMMKNNKSMAEVKAFLDDYFSTRLALV